MSPVPGFARVKISCGERRCRALETRIMKKPNRPNKRQLRRIAGQFTLAMLAAAPAWGQAVTPANPPSTPATAISPEDDEVIELSPFEVNDTSRGYQATNTMSGTRLNTRIEDLAASISVVTKQQLLDTAAVDINDIFLYEAGTEGTHQFTDFAIENSGAAGDIVVDRTGTDPAGANRVRGLGSANISLGGFETTAGIPIDTYNVDAVEISRGPNSNIFGLGNPAG